MAHLVLVAAILFATLAGGGGVAYAADAAVPGDPLYGIDRALESLRLHLTGDVGKRVELLLSFAAERLGEAEALAGEENTSYREMALDSYGQTIATLARAVGSAEGLDEDALGGLIETALSAQEGRLSQMLVEGDMRGDRCASMLPHPVLEALAEAHGVDYETLIGWFCKGAVPAIDPPVEAPPIGVPPVDPPTGDPPLELPVQGPPVDPPTGDPPLEPPVQGPPVEPPTGDPPVEPPVQGPLVEPPIGDPPVEPPVQGPPVEPQTDDPPVEPPVDEPPVEPPVSPPKR